MLEDNYWLVILRWRLQSSPLNFLNFARTIRLRPDEFSEPGLFLIRPDGTLFASTVQTMPFARPKFDDLLGAIQFVIKNDYPARGEA